MKIDLHLHSKYSKRPSQWVLQKIGCPESFAEPMMLNRLRKEKGMTGFTLTDHNTIAGAMEIAHLPHAFISEEVTTYFPEDHCKVHVLVWDINETIHEDIQKIRENIYDLVTYLNQNGIVHSLAHPLFSVNDRLTYEHFEKFLLLFRTFEMNGARDDAQNVVLKTVLENLGPNDMEELQNRHDIKPLFDKPWKKNLTGGSDDHSALNVARLYTEVPGAKNSREFLEGLRNGLGKPRGRGATPLTLAHNLYSIAYQFYNSRLNIGKYANQDILMRFLNRLLEPEPQAQSWLPMKLQSLLRSPWRRQVAASEKVEDVIRSEGEKTITSDPKLCAIIRDGYHAQGQNDERWFQFVNQVCNKVLYRFGTELYGHLSGANVFSLFTSIGAAGSLYSLLAPYFVSFGLFGRDRPLQNRIMEHYAPPRTTAETGGKKIKVAHFTDTFYEINGVAWTLRQQAELARATGKDLTIITCSRQPGMKVNGQVKCFTPIEVFELPVYKEQKLFLPPFLEMLKHVYENNYNYIHSATPGPIGLVALAIARILKLPISGTYHTAIPQYSAYLTGDDAIEQLVWRYTLWYYDQMDMIYVPSYDTGGSLASKGINPEKILIYPRGVDTDNFHPQRRNGYYERKFQLKNKTKVLYVGRVSKEKNMPVLVNAFKKLVREQPDLHLIVVGDGPYLDEMKDELKDRPVTFTGYLQGRELSEAFASADLFVFPSTTDTFGNVILEAQASGLPVIVTDTGGPRENMIPGMTGLVIPGGDENSLVEAVIELTRDELRLRRMAHEARDYMEKRSFQAAFLEHWKMYSREGHTDKPTIARAS